MKFERSIKILKIRKTSKKLKDENVSTKKTNFQETDNIRKIEKNVKNKNLQRIENME